MSGLRTGDRVGVPWLGHTCGTCAFCRSGRENLCDAAEFTGYTRDGGFAEYTVADAHYVFPIPDSFSDRDAAPLLCAGLIGYRALTMAGEGKRLGLYGFGAAAHIIAQVARHQGREVYAFTRPGDEKGKDFRADARRGLGRGFDGRRRRPCSTPRSSSRRSARWCRRRCARWRKAGGWSAPAFI